MSFTLSSERVKLTPAQIELLLEIVFPGVGVPVHGGGGDQLKVKPETGTIDVVKAQVSEFNPPAVVADQSVAVVLLL